MKWKQKGCKQANREMGKYDYLLWYGVSEHDYYQVQGLFRDRTVARRSQANCQIAAGKFVSHEQLCFGSRRAAHRYVIKHREWFVVDYANRNNGCTPKFVKIIPWRGKRYHREGTIILAQTKK